MPPNAGVQRRRTAPNEGRPLAPLSPARNILTDFTFPVSDDSQLVASGMTERGAGAVRCNDLLGGIIISMSSNLPHITPYVFNHCTTISVRHIRWLFYRFSARFNCNPKRLISICDIHV